MSSSQNTTEANELIEPAIEVVQSWPQRARALESGEQRRAMEQLESIVTDEDAVAFVMSFVDRVVRPESNRVAAAQLRSLLEHRKGDVFLGTTDRLLLRTGARLSRVLPGVVMPLARWRMRAIVGQLIGPAEPERLASHLGRHRAAGYAMNVNLLGEAVLGEREAQRRLDELLALLDQPDVDYVSVKISAVASQLNHFAHDASVERVIERIRLLVDRAATVQPATFLNFDMEEYHDLDLTLEAFMAVLSEPGYTSVDAGIVLQAYLPDAFDALQRLTSWANERERIGGGQVKVRLVKGANLAMERVDAAMHGWEQAPYASKHEVDANYKQCIDWLLHPQRMSGVRLGLASHNLFDVAWTRVLSMERNVADRVQIEMLQGMAPAQAAAVADASATAMLLYTPIVRSVDFDVAISYLFRRLEENASEDNFLRQLFDLEIPEVFAEQAERFAEAVADRHHVPTRPRRTQNRLLPASPAYEIGAPFLNEPETDPVLASNSEWITSVMATQAQQPNTERCTSAHQVDECLQRGRSAQSTWQETPLEQRQILLHAAADHLASRRGELVATMIGEASKAFAEADGEVSEAIDFCRWYGDACIELAADDRVTFDPFGVVAVVPPWNFPVAIPTGGVAAAVAAGNSVVLKPAPETARCAEIVAEAFVAAGLPAGVVQFIRTPDDEVGQRLVTGADAVILTGSAETARLFQQWKPAINLFAETSGKNSLVITPNADLDLAVADLVQSAFGHSGQKCSAASLAIFVGPVGESERFLRQLKDAVQSLDVAPPTNLEATVTPLVGGGNDRLDRALETLGEGESWLVEPRCLDAEAALWSPGVIAGVRPGSWFHRTECFGPVLGLMAARDLAHAISIQNDTDFGLTGGIHTLDPGEANEWVEKVEIGNAYVNRPITGAIVQRQPFGGWKQSSVGPGAKAGGPNYVAQLGTWRATAPILTDDFDAVWSEHFAVDHDETALFCEANVFRYRSLGRIGLVIGPDTEADEPELVRRAAAAAGVVLIELSDGERFADFADRLRSHGVDRARWLGSAPSPQERQTATARGIHLATAPVLPVGRIELLHYVREQAVTQTLHRFGNLVAEASQR